MWMRKRERDGNWEGDIEFDEAFQGWEKIIIFAEIGQENIKDVKIILLALVFNG